MTTGNTNEAEGKKLSERIAEVVATYYSTPFYAADPQYSAALALSQSPDFRASAGKPEKEFIICEHPVMVAADTMAEAWGPGMAARKMYNHLMELSEDENGLVRMYKGKDGEYHTHPILQHYGKEMDKAESPYWFALDALGKVLNVEIIVRIKEALALAGVTEEARANEICRCALMGGDLFDGDSTEEAYQKHEAEAPARYEARLSAKAVTEAAPLAADPLACPHCGNPTDPNKTRCPFCERLIG